MYKKYYCLLIIALVAACSQPTTKKEDNKTVASSGDSISLTRAHVNPKPVASYHVPMGNPKLNRQFGVDIYETSKTFKFLLAMQFDAMLENDTLTIPNFGQMPVVQIKPGPGGLSCIIGFLDKEKNFKEYKLLSAKNDQLRLTTINNYGVETYTK